MVRTFIEEFNQIKLKPCRDAIYRVSTKAGIFSFQTKFSMLRLAKFSNLVIAFANLQIRTFGSIDKFPVKEMQLRNAFHRNPVFDLLLGILIRIKIIYSL